MSFERSDLAARAASARRAIETRPPESRDESRSAAAVPPREVELRERIALARRYHGAGRRTEAELLCREVLRLAPDDAEALHLSAMLAHEAGAEVEALELIDRALAREPRLEGGHRTRGAVLQALSRPDDALGAFREAIALLPADAQAWFGLGEALRNLERRPEALQAYQEAARLTPEFAEALLYQGVVLVDLGRTAEALAALQGAARIRPDLPAVQDRLGCALGAAGRWNEAVEAHRLAIDLDPSGTDAYCHLGAALCVLERYHDAADALQAALALEPQSPEAHNRMGMVLRGLGYLDQALSAFRQALAGQPDFAEAHFNLGVLLAELNRPAEALASLRAALAFRAEYAGAHAQIGTVLLKLGRSIEAITAYRHALGLAPGVADTWYRLGNAMRDERRPREAIAAYDRALELTPDLAVARYQRGLALLGLGEYRAGWAGYEYRGKIAELRIPERKFTAPRWNGEPLHGRTLLVHAEPGIEDALRFVRYLPLLVERGARLVLECPGSLRRFLEAMPAVSQAVSFGEPLPPAHFHIPLASLPRFFTADLASLPTDVPYLPTRIWSTRVPLLPAGEGARVGIAWNGSEGHGSRNAIPLAALASLFAVPGLSWYSLEFGDSSSQREATLAAGVCDLAPLVRDLADSAALIAQLDLVITVDGAIAELAGGLGIETWVLLAAVPGWQWGTEGEASAWYPTARLFRQAQAGGWAVVVDEVRRLLAASLAA